MSCRKLYDIRRCSVAFSCLRAGRANVEARVGFVRLNLLSATHVFHALDAWKEAKRDLALAFSLLKRCRSKRDF